jgi:hypothetical protein
MQMSSNEALDAKAEEIREQLIKWAYEERILGPGETLIFSLRIQQDTTVRRDEEDTKTVALQSGTADLVPSGNMRAHHEFIAPAKLTESESSELLAILPSSAQSVVSQLLQLNGRALRTYAHAEGLSINIAVDSVNNKLRSRLIGGKSYYLLRQMVGEHPTHEQWCQLWEVRKK